MTRMFSMIFVILFFFIMVLCAFQPICFAHAVETGDSLVLSVKLIEFGSNRIKLMLDKYTPLTPRFIRDNPDYKVYVSCTGKFHLLVDVAVGDSYGDVGLMNGVDTNTLYEFSYANSTIDTYADKYDDFLDSPIYLSSGQDMALFSVYASKNYEVPVLDRLAVVGNEVFKNSQTLINFIIKYPLLLISFGLLLVSSIIAITKRVFTVG